MRVSGSEGGGWGFMTGIWRVLDAKKSKNFQFSIHGSLMINSKKYNLSVKT